MNSMKKSVKKSIIIMMSICILLLMAVYAIIIANSNKKKNNIKYNDKVNNHIVEMYEIQNKYENGVNISKDMELLITQMRNDRVDKDLDDNTSLYVVVGCSVALIILIFGFIYLVLLKPFDELEEYADEIAKGNLDKEFRYRRVNIFGKFTWAFDHMRTSIISARRNEQSAIENNKTVIATLSHDIKTPVASIRGYAEALTMNMDSNPERRSRYAEVIMSKCDEVSKITNDMFIHSLHDLGHLMIKNEEVMLGQVIEKSLEDMNAEGLIRVRGDIDGAVLHNADASRIVQVIENIIGNAKKYAQDSPIDVKTTIEGDRYILTIRDSGPGIPDSDLPFIFDKFYRGQNVKDAPGSGLGLFIVKYIMGKMGGKVELYNDNGLVVNLTFVIC